MTEILMNTNELATFLEISPLTVKKWRRQGKGPMYHRVSAKCIRCAINDVLEWLKALAVQPCRKAKGQWLKVLKGGNSK